jgi:hypothetical protein
MAVFKVEGTLERSNLTTNLIIEIVQHTIMVIDPSRDEFGDRMKVLITATGLELWRRRKILLLSILFANNFNPVEIFSTDD